VCENCVDVALNTNRANKQGIAITGACVGHLPGRPRRVLLCCDEDVVECEIHHILHSHSPGITRRHSGYIFSFTLREAFVDVRTGTSSSNFADALRTLALYVFSATTS